MLTVNRIRLVKPQLVENVEANLIQAAQKGSLGGKVDDSRMKGLLTSMESDSKPKVTVSLSEMMMIVHLLCYSRLFFVQFQRKNYFDDDSDDDNDDDLLWNGRVIQRDRMKSIYRDC